MSLMYLISCFRKKIGKAIRYLLIQGMQTIYFHLMRKLDRNIRKQENGPIVR